MDAAERDARERVERVYAAVDRLTADDLASIPVAERDLEQRTIQLADLEATADRAGRGRLLDDARDTLRRAVAARLVSRLRDEAGVAGQITTGRPADIAGLMLALEDAVAVAATEDLIDPVAAATLADPGRRILRLEPLFLSPAGPSPARVRWEPSAEDWAAAAGGGPIAVDHDEPMAGNRAVQARFFELVGAAGAMIALGIGLVAGQPLLGALGALAIIGLAWTFARYRRPINRP